MPVFGLVITAEGDAAKAIASLRELANVDTGDAHSGRFPAALDCEFGQEHAMLDAIRAAEGVATVDVAFADFSDVDGPIDTQHLRRGRKRRHQRG